MMRFFPSRWKPLWSALFSRCIATCSHHRYDLVVISVLMALAGIASYIGSGLLPTAMLSKDATDVWFDADLSRVFDNMVSRSSDNKRADVHPFFALFTFFPVVLLKTIANLDNWSAVRLILAAVAAANISLFYTLLRCMGLRRISALVFTLLAAVSASSMFWSIVPETLPFGALTILLALIFVVVASQRPLSPAWGVAINLLTLSMTITNWAVGLLATVVSYTRQQSIRIVACAVCVAIVLSALQLAIFPRAAPFGVSNRVVAEEAHFLIRKDAGSPIDFVKTFAFHSMVMPKIEHFDHYWSWSKWPVLRVQLSSVGSGTAWGIVAALLWFGLIGLGIWAMLTLPVLPSLRFVVGGALLTQLGLHAVFGRETFLYAPHFVPLLIIVAAFGALTPWRHVVTALAGGLLLTAGINNVLVLKDALAFVGASQPPSAPLQVTTDISPLVGQRTASSSSSAIALRGAQGKVIGTVGPGGSFTLGDSGFAISIWVLHNNDVVLTSDTHWSPSTSQRIVWPWVGSPFVETNNWYYQTTAREGDPGKWALEIKHVDNMITRLVAVIRSVSGSTTPIRAAEWDGKRLLINNRWKIEVTPAPTDVRVGEEESPGRFVSHAAHWESGSGLGYALINLDQKSKWWQLEVSDMDNLPPKLGDSPSP